MTFDSTIFEIMVVGPSSIRIVERNRKGDERIGSGSFNHEVAGEYFGRVHLLMERIFMQHFVPIIVLSLPRRVRILMENTYD